jgi:hypothetical protein
LNTHGGRDHGPRITVRELLMQTSGVPDYFEQKRPDGTTFLADMLRTDAAWTSDELIDMARGLPSPFAPSTPETHLELCQAVLPFGKATYVDKTFAPDLATAREIFALADQHAAAVGADAVAF